MKKLFVLLALWIFPFMGCQKEEDPFYEVVPVVEVTNIFFDDVERVRLNIDLNVDGVSTISTWDIPFKGVRYGCSLIKWTGEPVEYQAPSELKLTVSVLYDLGDGFVLIDNLSDANLIKSATWIRAYFEVRDRYNPSDRFVGIEQYNNPTAGEWQAPTVEWTVGDFNGVPSQASPSSSNLRVESPVECKECIWDKIK